MSKHDTACLCTDCRLSALEKQVFLQDRQPQPRTPRLVEACEITLAYVRNMDTEAVFESFHAMELALAAEKRRQGLVDKVIQAARSQLSPDIMDAPCGCPCCEAIAALDAFDKERRA